MGNLTALNANNKQNAETKNPEQERNKEDS